MSDSVQLELLFGFSDIQTAAMAFKVVGAEHGSKPRFGARTRLQLNKNIVSAHISAPDIKSAFLNASDCVHAIAFIQKTRMIQ